MARDVTDPDGIIWSCIQAFAGLGNDPEKVDAARVEGAPDRVHVVCTPGGGAKSVRLELPGNWEQMPDDDLLQEIRFGLAGQ